MQCKKILWLVSWYPNKNDRFDGDFIQRHARAAAIYHDVHVIFVTDADIKKSTEEEWNYATGLTEQIVYFKKRKGIIARTRKQLTWKNSFQNAVKNYIEKNGLPDCVHVHVPWKAGLIALWMKKKYGKEFIVTEHWGIYDHTIDGNIYKKPELNQKLLREVYQSAKLFVTVSKYLADGVKKFSGKVAEIIIPNVVDTTLFLPKDEKYSKFTFIHISNMTKLKNADQILIAFKKTLDSIDTQMQLIMIGNKNNECMKLAEELNLLNSTVFFKGEISYVEVAAEMKKSHCLVLFSDSETFSCVSAEAVCSGIPVLASNVGALPEIINTTNGVLVPSLSPEILSIAMVEMTERYQSFNHKIMAEQAAKKFSYSTIAESFDELYKSC